MVVAPDLRPDGDLDGFAGENANGTWNLIVTDMAGQDVGNLTRFDVSRVRRTTEFWHFDLAGEHEIEDTDVHDETVESVTCRWCGRSDAVEVVARAES